jgi:HEAT repeat protein
VSNRPTRDGLLADLQDPSAQVRQRAALTLSTTPDATLENEIVRAVVRERDPLVRDTLTRALAECSDGVVPRLIDLLDDADAEVRQHAAHVLGKRADPGATEALSKAAADVDSAVAYKAVFALGRIRNPRSIDTLVRALAHVDDRVRDAAADALRGFGADAVPALGDALPTASTEQRRQIAYALGGSQSFAGLAAVRDLLADSSPTVRFAALHALLMADPAGAAAASMTMRNDSDPKVRALAMRCHPADP